MHCSVREMQVNVGIVCCKNHLAVGTTAAAHGRMDKYTCQRSVCSRISNCVLCPLSTLSPLLQCPPQYISYCQPLCFVEGQLYFGRLYEWVEAWAFFFYIYSSVFLPLKIYLYLADGCVGGWCWMGA